jgi:hypothetical protein
MITNEQIEQRIADLTEQRDDFHQTAAQTIAHFNGQIQALEALLMEEAEVQPDKMAKEQGD